jgi:hypothetical protein
MALIISRHARRARCLLAFAFAAALATEPTLIEGQENPAAPAAPTQGASAAPAASEQAPASQNQFTRAELRKLLAPIALYPDPLLAQLLPASAYSVQIVQAQRWLDKNQAAVANNDFSWIDSQDWDPAVKALARFPNVIKMMSDDLDWTTDLGDAEVNQPQDVADVIQELRAKAQQNNVLKTTEQQTVTTTQQTVTTASGGSAQQSYIEIQPTDPATVYVPSYDPAAVYEPYTGVAPLLGFGAGIAVGALWNSNYWNWGTGAIYPPAWAGYPGWRPPYAGWRPGQPVCPGGRCGNINIGNDINIGNNVKSWRPNADYRPGMGSKPGIGANRPGGVGRPGRPGGVGGVGGPGRPGGIGGIGGPGGPGGPGGVGGPGRPGGVGGVGGPGRPGGPGGAGRPGGPGGAGGPGRSGSGQAANRPAARPGNRPGGGQVANRPAARPANRPAARPAARAGSRPGSSAMGGVRMGGANAAFASRGAMSRGAMGRPGGFGGGGMRGGGAAMRGGGGFGGGGMRGGGGGARRGGGGRRSDMRLKHDIVLLGRLDGGLGYYRFVYNGGHTAYVGVMAQEVRTVAPEAVSYGGDGYLRVSYDLLGLPFETYQQWVATGAHLPSVKPVAH